MQVISIHFFLSGFTFFRYGVKVISFWFTVTYNEGVNFSIKMTKETGMIREKFRNYFGKMNLHKRLLSYFVIVCIIPLVTIGSISIISSIQATRSSAIQFSDSTLLQVKTRLESIMDQADTLSLSLADDSTIQTALKKPMSDNVIEQYATDLAMDTYLNYEMSYITDIYGFYIIGENKGKYKSAYNSYHRYDLTTTLWYHQLIDSDQALWFPTYKESRAVQTSGQYFISRGMPIKDKTSSDNLGVILVDIELEKIEQILRDSFGDLGQVMIIDEHNRIVASSANLYDNQDPAVLEAINLTADSTEVINNATHANAIVLNHSLKNNDWHLIGIVPSNFLIKDSLISTVLFFGVVILITVLSYYISKIITSTITNSVNNIISLMKEVESGNMEVRSEVLYDDEIGKLSISFNKMTEQVKTLMERIVEEQHKLRRYELVALQAQINPHFMYNTLDSVIWLARMKRHEDIVEIVGALTQFFRIGLSRGKDIITIRDEIEHVTSYLLIQKHRYKEHLEYVVDIPESLESYVILKLVLQPLVENAIYHGLKVKREGGIIYITAKEIGDNIEFRVRDTGVGMDPETLNGINRAFETRFDSHITMYGIKNVNDRIGIFFGTEYGLRYESSFGEGTVAILTIPKQIGDEPNVKNYNH